MITSLTTRYRVVFTLSLVLCVLLVSGVPVDAESTSPYIPFVDSTRRGYNPVMYIMQSDNGKAYSIRHPQLTPTTASISRGWEVIEMPLGSKPKPGRELADDRDPDPRPEPTRTERCDVEWGHWYVDVITHVIPKLQINTLTNVTTGIPVMGKLSVTTKYTERRDGEEICRVYIDGSYSHSRSRGTRTETRTRERTDYNSIKVIDHAGDLTVLRINETSGDLVLQWSNRYDAYRVHVDVVTFDGSLKQNLPVQVYIWPNGQTTSAIKVQTYRGVTVD